MFIQRLLLVQSVSEKFMREANKGQQAYNQIP